MNSSCPVPPLLKRSDNYRRLMVVGSSFRLPWTTVPTERMEHSRSTSTSSLANGRLAVQEDDTGENDIENDISRSSPVNYAILSEHQTTEESWPFLDPDTFEELHMAMPGRTKSSYWETSMEFLLTKDL